MSRDLRKSEREPCRHLGKIHFRHREQQAKALLRMISIGTIVEPLGAGIFKVRYIFYVNKYMYIYNI